MITVALILTLIFLCGLALALKWMGKSTDEVVAELEASAQRRVREATPDPQLLATGEPAEALVVTCDETGFGRENEPVIRLVLDVRRASGGAAYRPEQSTYRAEVKMFVPALKFAQVQPGSVVGVRVEPRDPSRIAVVLR